MNKNTFQDTKRKAAAVYERSDRMTESTVEQRDVSQHTIQFVLCSSTQSGNFIPPVFKQNQKAFNQVCRLSLLLTLQWL